jgi:hypothetical protein
VAFAPEVFFDFFEGEQKSCAVEGEDVNMPGNRGEVVDVVERRVKEQVAEP